MMENRHSTVVWMQLEQWRESNPMLQQTESVRRKRKIQAQQHPQTRKNKQFETTATLFDSSQHRIT